MRGMVGIPEHGHNRGHHTGSQKEPLYYTYTASPRLSPPPPRSLSLSLYTN